MADVDPFVIDLTPESLQDPETVFYLERFLHDLWIRTGGGTDLAQEALNSTADSSILTPIKQATTYQKETAVDYTVTGDFDSETVICTNTSNITVTMPVHYEGAQVTVTRSGLGGVTIDGDGTNILGISTQTLPMQYDSADMKGSSTEWVL